MKIYENPRELKSMKTTALKINANLMKSKNQGNQSKSRESYENTGRTKIFKTNLFSCVSFHEKYHENIQKTTAETYENLTSFKADIFAISSPFT